MQIKYRSNVFDENLSESRCAVNVEHPLVQRLGITSTIFNNFCIDCVEMVTFSGYTEYITFIITIKFHSFVFSFLHVHCI